MKHYIIQKEYLILKNLKIFKKYHQYGRVFPKPSYINIMFLRIIKYQLTISFTHLHIILNKKIFNIIINTDNII